jgi:hypothetical protein
VTLHPEGGFSAEFEFNRGIEGNALIASSGISIDHTSLKTL